MLRGVVLLLGAACAWAQPGVVQWDFEQPLRVCTASIQDFGARCNGAPHPSLEDLPQPIGSVPPEGWCLPNVDFCGYDVAVFQCAAPSHSTLTARAVTSVTRPLARRGIDRSARVACAAIGRCSMSTTHCAEQ